MDCNSIKTLQDSSALVGMTSASNQSFLSAVLYEQKLPYADGLRPMVNYQAALRPMVLEVWRRFKQPAKKPIDILTEKLRRLRHRDYTAVAYGHHFGVKKAILSDENSYFRDVRR